MRAPIFALVLTTGCAAMTDSDLPASDENGQASCSTWLIHRFLDPPER